MGCTCRAPARCPICNTPVRVPLSNLDRLSAGVAQGARPARREGANPRAGLGHLIQGSSPCPNCGHSVRADHTRSCVSKALVSAGVPVADREVILARITFPEG